MAKMQFICDVCHSPLFTPIVELEVIEENGTYKIVESQGSKRWKCSKCGEIIGTSEIDMQSQKVYKFKDGDEIDGNISQR